MNTFKGKDDIEFEKVEKRIRHKIMVSALFRYNLQRAKQKISFSALTKNFTIQELFLRKIMHSYKILTSL